MTGTSNVLIVDDRPENLLAMEALLGDLPDVRVVQASSGSEALWRSLEEDFALALLDVQMPGMDGFETATLLRGNQKTRDLPIIFVTAISRDREHFQLGYASGAVDYLLKPIEPDVLRGKVRIFCEMHRQKIREKESATWLSTTLNSIGDGVIATDAQGRVSFINPVACALAGWEEAEAIGRPLEQVFSPLSAAGRQPLVPPVREALATGRTVALDAPALLPRHGGGEAYIQAKASPLRLEGGAVAGTVLVFSDISAAVRAEEEREKMQAQLLQAQKMEAVGTLAGGIAHDFNNILTAISGYVSLLQFKLGERSPLRDYADQIYAAAERAAELTRSLLAFSRKQRTETKPVDLNEILRGVQKILARLIGEDVSLHVSCAPGPLVVQADRSQIEQVLMNLVANARDAMPSGGSIRISSEEARPEAMEGGGTPGPHALLVVSDTGSGMDEHTRAHAFEPFFTTKEVGKGTGLGLSIVYGIVKSHGGEIHVESRPGKGTSFRIFLPLLAAKASAGVGRPEPLLQAGSGTILVVEDDDGTRNVTRSLLEECGYTVLEARDGEEAVALLRGRGARVDLVLSDVIMPGKNGRETCEELKAIVPGLKTVFMSGYSAEMVAQRGILEGGATFVPKPVRPADLLRAIRDALGR